MSAAAAKNRVANARMAVPNDVRCAVVKLNVF